MTTQSESGEPIAMAVFEEIPATPRMPTRNLEVPVDILRATNGLFVRYSLSLRRHTDIGVMVFAGRMQKSLLLLFSKVAPPKLNSPPPQFYSLIVDHSDLHVKL